MNKIAVLCSGAGRSLSNLIYKTNSNMLDAKIVLVATDRHCPALKVAKDACIPTFQAQAPWNTYKGVALHPPALPVYAPIPKPSDEIWDRIRSVEADLVCMAGYLSLLPIPQDYENRVMNIHPSLLPAFGGKGMYGKKVHEAVHKSGVKWTGCTIHFVDDEYDHGPIILQKIVPIVRDDTPETIANKVFFLETQAYPDAIKAFFSSHILVSDGKAIIVDN